MTNHVITEKKNSSERFLLSFWNNFTQTVILIFVDPDVLYDVSKMNSDRYDFGWRVVTTAVYNRQETSDLFFIRSL